MGTNELNLFFERVKLASGKKEKNLAEFGRKAGKASRVWEYALCKLPNQIFSKIAKKPCLFSS